MAAVHTVPEAVTSRASIPVQVGILPPHPHRQLQQLLAHCLPRGHQAGHQLRSEAVLALGEQREGDAVAVARPAGASHAVHVRVNVPGAVQVDDRLEAASGEGARRTALQDSLP